MDELCLDIRIFRHTFQEGHPGSRALLNVAASRYAGISGDCLGAVETGPWGKPFFPRMPHVHFSVTHSGNWWLCAFSSQPLGLDLQIHQSYTAPSKLSHRFFHPLEDAFLSERGYRDFFDLWCAKESWVKYTGHGFFDDPDSFSVVSSDNRFPVLDGVQFRLVPFAPEYSLCLCAQDVDLVTLTEL
ncbi:MAG: 4'-phosphopantetheinyl transferase superfamily protein [Lawsonibacter sp.]|nr:4'-phosphopantetheinyl transferase superfamily protein [Lawsonibacter sp.]